LTLGHLHDEKDGFGMIKNTVVLIIECTGFSGTSKAEEHIQNNNDEHFALIDLDLNFCNFQMILMDPFTSTSNLLSSMLLRCWKPKRKYLYKVFKVHHTAPFGT
jgi:hypothetical protein